MVSREKTETWPVRGNRFMNGLIRWRSTKARRILSPGIESWIVPRYVVNDVGLVFVVIHGLVIVLVLLLFHVGIIVRFSFSHLFLFSSSSREFCLLPFKELSLEVSMPTLLRYDCVIVPFGCVGFGCVCLGGTFLTNVISFHPSF